MDNRRKTIVINKKFQYQYSLLIAALAVLLVNGFIIARILFPGNDPLAISTTMALGIALVEALLIGSIWYGSLKASHKIAGPVFVFAREISRLGSGDLTASINLRDKDMFQPEGAAMNNAIAKLRDRIGSAKGLTQQLQTAQSDGEDTSAIIQKLNDELAHFKTDSDA